MKTVLFICCSVAFIRSTCATSETLELVHVFFRHGSRTPELKDMYPTDPHTLETFWPYGHGALTNKGKQKAFALGHLLRARYDSFLGDIYIPEMLEARSTDFDRTKMTLMLVLAGLFPPSVIQTWNESIPWQPIPISYDKDSSDYTLKRPLAYCPTYKKELEEVMLSDEAQKVVKTNQQLFKYIEKHSKKRMKTLLHVFGIYQTLTAEKTMNLTLPDWTQSVYPDQVQAVAGMQCYFENYTPTLKRLNGGRMLEKIIEHMVQKSINNLSPPERKIYLYSGHENNVINILAALNLFEPHVPEYASAVIVELHHLKESGYGVKVLYLRDSQSVPEEQILEGCDVICPLNNFRRIVKPHVPRNYTAECNSPINLD